MKILPLNFLKFFSKTGTSYTFFWFSRNIAGLGIRSLALCSFAQNHAYYQGWEFTHLLIAHLLICSFCSKQMSFCERFAQIAQDK